MDKYDEDIPPTFVIPTEESRAFTPPHAIGTSLRQRAAPGVHPARIPAIFCRMNRRLRPSGPARPSCCRFLLRPRRFRLSRLSDYLNGLTTVETDFTQINSDGSISTGKIYIKRPGRVRFEYAPPDRSLVIAGGQQVAIFDAKSNQPPEQYPLKRTPLNLILAENIDLGRASMVVGHSDDGTSTRVRAQDPENPEYGSIELVFTARPGRTAPVDHHR